MIRFAAAQIVFVMAAVLSAGSAYAQLPTGTWQLQWADEFTRSSLDTKKWSANYPWGATHNHDAYMSPENLGFGDGTLTITAERQAQGGKPFTSGAISTGYTKFTANGGYIEARILLPNTPGSWPAFWGLYNGWPPEADIMEYPIDTVAGTGYAQDQYHTAFHYVNASGGNSAGAGQANPSSAGDLGGAYHNFGMEWIEDDWVGFYFDGALVSQFGTDVDVAEMQSMYLILNYAVGGWPGTPSTAEWPVGHTDQMKVDWVRVWKGGEGAQAAPATTTNWAYSGASELVQWDTASNWSNGSPNLGGVTANFSTVIPVEQRLDWSGIRAISNLNYDGATRYVVGFSDDRLFLVGANSGTGNASITIQATSTVQHTIRAEVELWSTLAITNDSAQPLLLSGQFFGGRGINIDGPGPVVFANSNIYTGDTVIDTSAVQGPAIARVTNSQPFGTGVVIIGQAGNSTSARLEMENNTLVPNAISLNGRNNSTVGILNRSGNNILSGTISAQVGGGQYTIQSDAGLLTLSGAANGANGVALQAGASGSRTFTLQGASGGLVSGRIENGSGTVSIIKSGAGTWALNAANTYSGTTSVSQGVLIVNGATGTGLTTVASGATLGGTGTIAGGLSALGNVAPGNSAGTLIVTGNAAFATGSALSIEVFGTTPGSQFDRLVVTGQLSAGGNLNVSLMGGFVPTVGASFDLLDWSSRTGTFANVNLPILANCGWDTTKLYSDGIVSVVSTLPGDIDGSGLVDAADYVVWRKIGGTQTQYDDWRSHFGRSVGTGSIVSASVPEPANISLACGALIALTAIQASRRRHL